jgi:hypothetical protein
MGHMVIVAYKPLPGKEARLFELTREHVPILRRLGLATNRPALAMKARDGTIVEVFEWVSAEAVQKGHEHPDVLAMWGRYAEACTYVPLTGLEETKHMFANFEPIELA